MYLCSSMLGFAHSAGRDELIMHKIQEVIIFSSSSQNKKGNLHVFLHSSRGCISDCNEITISQRYLYPSAFRSDWSDW